LWEDWARGLEVQRTAIKNCFEPKSKVIHEKTGRIGYIKIKLSMYMEGTHIFKKQNPEKVFDMYVKKVDSWALVAHAYNPSYSGGRD
jgi:hypothetical protein